MSIGFRLQALIVFAIALAGPFIACSSRRAGESPYPGTSQPRTLAVMAVFGEAQDESWQDLRIGFGLASLVAEELHRTGRFLLVEEKPEIQEKLRALREKGWRAGPSSATPAALDRAGADLGVQAIASGTVTSFASPKSRTYVGPFGTRSNTVEIEVRVCIEDLVLARLFCDKGSGEATVEAQEAFFEFKGEEVVFDRTTVGAATAEAVRVAVKKLMRER